MKLTLYNIRYFYFTKNLVQGRNLETGGVTPSRASESTLSRRFSTGGRSHITTYLRPSNKAVDRSNVTIAKQTLNYNIIYLLISIEKY